MRRYLKALILTLSVTLLAGCTSSEFSTARQQNAANEMRLAELENLPEVESPKILPETYLAAGKLFEHQGALRKAITQYQHAIATKHDYVEAYHRLGLVLSRVGNHTASARIFKQGLTFDKNNASFHNNIGWELALLERWTESQQWLRKAIQLDPDFTRAHINLGIVLSQQDRFDEAFQSFFAVLPEADAHYNMGLMFRGKQHYAKAAESFKHVLRLNPQFVAAQRQLDEIAHHLESTVQWKEDQLDKSEAFANAETWDWESQDKWARIKDAEEKFAQAKRLKERSFYKKVTVKPRRHKPVTMARATWRESTREERQAIWEIRPHHRTVAAREQYLATNCLDEDNKQDVTPRRSTLASTVKVGAIPKSNRNQRAHEPFEPNPFATMKFVDKPGANSTTLGAKIWKSVFENDGQSDHSPSFDDAQNQEIQVDEGVNAKPAFKNKQSKGNSSDAFSDPGKRCETSMASTVIYPRRRPPAVNPNWVIFQMRMKLHDQQLNPVQQKSTSLEAQRRYWHKKARDAQEKNFDHYRAKFENSDFIFVPYYQAFEVE